MVKPPGLKVPGCEPKVLIYSRPVRVPRAWRDGTPQNADLAETIRWLRIIRWKDSHLAGLLTILALPW